jgi:hypothetical protein
MGVGGVQDADGGFKTDGHGVVYNFHDTVPFSVVSLVQGTLIIYSPRPLVKGGVAFFG